MGEVNRGVEPHANQVIPAGDIGGCRPAVTSNTGG